MMNILAVDDEIIALRLMERTIKEVMPDENIYSFNKAKEALELAGREHIDIAFLDIQMGNIDGLSMAKQLMEYNSKINIIFCTGYSEYALEALDMYASGYLLKPITTEMVKKAVEHLRYPVNPKQNKIFFRCFGNFEVFYDGKIVEFEYQKTKEMLAYLVDANGANCTTREIMAVLFDENDHSSYFQRLRRDLIMTFSKLGCEEIIGQSKGMLAINKDCVNCDYYDCMENDKNLYNGEYMKQYSFAEVTHANLEKKFKK